MQEMKPENMSAYRLILATRAAGVGIWDWDLSTDQIVWDDAMYRLYGIADRLPRTFGSWSKIVHPEDFERTNQELQEARNGLKDFDTEFRIFLPDGSLRHIKAIAMVLSNAAGVATRMIGTNWDITEKKKREEELEKINTEIKAKNLEMEHFVYAVSHDLRGPLVNIEGFNAELKRSLSELRTAMGEQSSKEEFSGIFKDIDEAIDFISISSSKMEKLIAAILSLSRLGRSDLSVTKVDMNELAEDTLKIMRQDLTNSQSSVTVHRLPSALCDKIAIGQVLMNLVGNAIKYRKNDVPPIIEIGGFEKDRTTTYWVKDNGLGISSFNKAKLFQIFQRFHQNVAPGNGIGLASVKKIIERHHGKVWAEDNGEGSTFYFSLPIGI